MPPIDEFDDPVPPRQASPLLPLARALFVIVLALIVYASLTPFSGWRAIGVPPLAYLTAPLPRYVTAFDLIVNVVGYVPLGLLAALALHPRLRGAGAALAATLLGVFLSASMEALQTYAPTRVASSLDLAANSLGSVLGALIGAGCGPGLIDRGRLIRLRTLWFRPDATVALVLVALWPLAQLHPDQLFLGNGDLRGMFAGIGETFRPLIDADRLRPEGFALVEALVASAGMLAAGLTLAAITLAGAPRARLLAGLLAAAVGVKTIAYGLQFGPEQFLGWATLGAGGGLALGLLPLLVGAGGRPRAVTRLALAATLALIVLVNFSPENPYQAHWLGALHPGRWLHAADAARWFASAWPFALLLWLLRAVARGFPRPERAGP